MNNLVLGLRLFWEFFKVGLFSVGGGPATLPYLMELGDKYQWFTMQELTNMIAISESTPGPLGINMATYVVSDLHGQYKMFKKLLEKAAFSDADFGLSHTFYHNYLSGSSFFCQS